MRFDQRAQLRDCSCEALWTESMSMLFQRVSTLLAPTIFDSREKSRTCFGATGLPLLKSQLSLAALAVKSASPTILNCETNVAAPIHCFGRGMENIDSYSCFGINTLKQSLARRVIRMNVTHKEVATKGFRNAVEGFDNKIDVVQAAGSVDGSGAPEVNLRGEAAG